MQASTSISSKFHQSRRVPFRGGLIRIVNVDGMAWLCETDMEKAIGVTFKIEDSHWQSGEIKMANIDGGFIVGDADSSGVTSMLCVTPALAKSLSARSNAPSENVAALWEWIEHQSVNWEPMPLAASEVNYRKKHKMRLFNQFHCARRFANSIEFDEAKDYALLWIDLLDEIDDITSLEERFELCVTNAADRPEIIESAKKYGARLTMHAILSVWKGGHSATYRGRDNDGEGFGEKFGRHLSWFTTIHRKDLNPMAQFFDLKDAFPEAKRPAPSEIAAQFEDLIKKRSSLVKLSRKNQADAYEAGMRNVAALYGSVAVLHAHVLSIMREAAADGSAAAIEASFSKVIPFCDEASATESEIIKIVRSDAADAPTRTLH